MLILNQEDGVYGYDEDQIALVVPDESKFVEWIPIYFGNPHYKLHHKCHEREGNRCLGKALGECQGGTPIIHA